LPSSLTSDNGKQNLLAPIRLNVVGLLLPRWVPTRCNTIDLVLFAIQLSSDRHALVFRESLNTRRMVMKQNVIRVRYWQESKFI